MRRPPMSIVATTMLAATCYAMIFLYFIPRVLSTNHDFACFYRAGKMVLTGNGALVYNLPAQAHFDEVWHSQLNLSERYFPTLPYVFTPHSLLIFAPLALLPYGKSEILWYALNAAALLAMPLVLRSQRMLGDGVCVAWTIAFPFFIPAVLALIQGQPSILLLALLTLAFIALRQGCDVLSGVLLAIAAIKPQFVLPLLVVAFLVGRRRVLIGFLSSLFALTLAATPLVGWRGIIQYPHALLGFNRMSDGEHPLSMPNLRGFLYALIHTVISNAHLTLLVALVSVLIVFVAASVLDKDSIASSVGFSFLAVVSIFVSFHGYVHDLVLLYLPILLLSGYFARSHWSWKRTPLAVSMVAVFLVPLISHPFGVMVFRESCAIMILAALLFGESIQPTPSTMPSKAIDERRVQVS